MSKPLSPSLAVVSFPVLVATGFCLASCKSPETRQQAPSQTAGHGHVGAAAVTVQRPVPVTVLRETDRSPVPHAAVVLNPLLMDPWTKELKDDPFAGSGIPRTDKAGQTTAPGLPGRIWVKAGNLIGMAKSRGGNAPVEVLLRPNNQPVRLRVTDQLGKPAAETPVVVIALSSRGPSVPVAWGQTDADGRFVFSDAGARAAMIGARRVMVAVGLPGAARHPSATATLDWSEPLPDLIDLRVPPTVRVDLVAANVPDDVDLADLHAVIADELGIPADGTPSGRGTWAATACVGGQLSARLSGGSVFGLGGGTVPRGDARPIRVLVGVLGRTVTLSGTVQAPGVQAVWASVPRPSWLPRALPPRTPPLKGRWVQVGSGPTESSFSIELPRSESSSSTEVSFRVSGPVDEHGRPSILQAETVTRSLDLSGDLDVGVLEFSVPAITGQLVDADGVGIAGVLVELQRPQEDAMDEDGDGTNLNWHESRIQPVLTDAEGRFTIAGLGQSIEMVRVKASPPGCSTVVSPQFESGERRGLKLRALQAGGLKGRVVSQVRSRIDNVELWFRPEQGIAQRANLTAVREVGGGFERDYSALALSPGTQQVVIGARFGSEFGDKTVVAGEANVVSGEVLDEPMGGALDLDSFASR